MTRVIVASVLIASAAAGAPTVVDRIVAVVGGEIILYSELETQVDLQMAMRRMDPNDVAARAALERRTLDMMIEDKLILLIAREDTTVIVNPEEVSQEVDAEVEHVRANFASEEEFRAALEAEGLAVGDLRSRFQRQVTNSLYTRKLIRAKFSGVTISNAEVTRYYEANRDSLPEEPPSVKLRHIMVIPKVGEETERRLRARADSIAARARAGEDFGELARGYSDDPSARFGGDLSWFGRGEMVQEFEAAAFALKPGAVSDPVRTQFGYHVIKTTEHLGERIRASHVLIAVAPSAEDSARTRSLADSIASSQNLAERFDTLVVAFSDDEASLPTAGELGWVPLEDLSLEFGSAFAEADSGTFVGPLESSAGFHVFLVEGRRTGHRMDPSDQDDFAALKQLALKDKKDRRLREWLSEERKRLFVDDRLDR